LSFDRRFGYLAQPKTKKDGGDGRLADKSQCGYNFTHARAVLAETDNFPGLVRSACSFALERAARRRIWGGKGRSVSTTRHIELEASVSLSDCNSTAPIDLEQLLPDVYEAVQWACLRHRVRIRRDELDDFSQQIILRLIEDNCRRLHSFKGHSSSKTWLQRVVENHIHNCLSRRGQDESFDEVDQGAFVYSSPQDQNIYNAEQRKLLSQALGRLNEQERLLYNLWFVSELAPIKIAAVFGTEASIVYKRKQTLVLKLTRFVQSFQSC
jgi:RNA polymerase sigma factor (sigma-70 family)